MNEWVQTIPFRARTAGERACRRCYYPFLATFVVAVILANIKLEWWVYAVLWNLPPAVWIFALAGLVGAWKDPSSRGLRLEASMALFVGYLMSATIVFLCDFWLPTFHDVAPDPN